jgi:hypothetical protein
VKIEKNLKYDFWQIKYFGRKKNYFKGGRLIHNVATIITLGFLKIKLGLKNKRVKRKK